MAEMITQRQLDSATNEYQRMVEEEEERRGRTDMFLHPRNVAAARLGMASLQAFRQVISTPEQIDLSPAHRARLAVAMRASKGFRDALLVYGQINVYGVTTKSERHKRSYWTRTADGNGIGGRKAPVPYGS